MVTPKDIETIFRTILLLFIILSANFLQHGLSCNIREHLRNSILDKQIFILLTIYFTVSLMDTDNELEIKKRIVYSLIIFLMFIIFQKTNKYFTITIFILLVISFTLNEKIKFNNLNNKQYKDEEKKIKNIINIIYIVSLLLLIIGHLIYFKKQYLEHKKNFNIKTFYLGTLTCDHIDYSKIVE